VSAEQLGVAVNSVETVLSSQTSNSPALNFLLYIPPIHRQVYKLFVLDIHIYPYCIVRFLDSAVSDVDSETFLLDTD
jgi:hypothetical protein